MKLKGKTALITGGTSGIGLGIATGFAKHGINLVINGRKEESEVKKQLNKLKKSKVKVHYIKADMTQPKEIEAMVKEAIKKFGAIDILVNNAGIQHVQPVEKFDKEKWDAIIATNLSASFHTVRASLTKMKKQGWGRIINIASAHALVASPFKSAYVSAKHGLLGFTKTVAIEVAKKNVTCNAICPGYVWTPLVEKQIPATAKERGITEKQVKQDVMLAAQWTKKFVTVEQIAETALFLCSDAAENINGTNISIDGGWTAS